MTEETLEYTLSIPKTELAQLPAAVYDGAIEVVDTVDRIASAIEVLRSAPLIGFDTETRPSFTRGARYKVSLLQLSTLDKCFLFRLNHIGLEGELKALLEDESVLKIGLSLHDDFCNLNKLAQLDPKGFVDLQAFVKDYRIADNSLSRIYAIVFGKRISKNQRLTNWEAKALTRAQQTYASLDAKACIDIYLHLKEGRFHPEESVYRVVPEPEVEVVATEEQPAAEPVVELNEMTQEESKDKPKKRSASRRKPKSPDADAASKVKTVKKGRGTKSGARGDDKKTVKAKASKPASAKTEKAAKTESAKTSKPVGTRTSRRTKTKTADTDS